MSKSNREVGEGDSKVVRIMEITRVDEMRGHILASYLAKGGVEDEWLREVKP